MARSKRHDRPVKKTLSLPTSLCTMVDEQLQAPITGKIPYGAWNSLIHELLSKWLRGEVRCKVMPKAAKKLDLDSLVEDYQ